MPTSPAAHAIAQSRIDAFHPEVVAEVAAAVAAHPIVVVGMAWNPNCPRALKALRGAGHTPHYLEYGSYLSGWKPRLAIKMWSSWPTYPQVFVRGKLLGGADQAEEAVKSGLLAKLLAE